MLFSRCAHLQIITSDSGSFRSRLPRDVVCCVGLDGLWNSVAVAQDLRHVRPFLDSCSSKPTILWFDQTLFFCPSGRSQHAGRAGAEAVVLCCVLSPQLAAGSAMSHDCSVCGLKTRCLRSHYSALVSSFLFASLCVPTWLCLGEARLPLFCFFFIFSFFVLSVIMGCSQLFVLSL